MKSYVNSADKWIGHYEPDDVRSENERTKQCLNRQIISVKTVYTSQSENLKKVRKTPWM
jgi:hypothetical protein